ncbi:unnamed protein product [Rotaria socialis]|uniref:Uncharacterized protein n=1 Tax=Rotaria socialis TaxID=392032 RepID=A0A821CED2_9BILA|nr:unnamed protein product [Rotaria socialis]CAF4605533.1 unnamed protein product [Rotaria socialis]
MATAELINRSNSTMFNTDEFLIGTRLQVVFDMETTITIVPETPDQISFLRYVLDRFGRSDLPLGIFNINAKPALSKFHLKLYPNTSIKESREALDGSDVLLKYCDERTILICGGPLENVAKAIQTWPFGCTKWLCW